MVQELLVAGTRAVTESAVTGKNNGGTPTGRCKNKINDLDLPIAAVRESFPAVCDNKDFTLFDNAADAPRIDKALNEMAPIEAEMTQVKSTSRDPSLVYPIMLDAQYANSGNVAWTADSVLPAKVYEVCRSTNRDVKR
ncbi:MAG TPA: hypothetical protein VOA41_19955 [Candidatus Dormibacteraeota bacterium]|nr:hypothetical protein [Candidatus Dormibacteraeota bacterium]